MNFPINLNTIPDDFSHIIDEPAFDPVKHLALEKPERIVSLAELGYNDDDIKECPSNLGITTPFKLLSDEGAATLQHVARQLKHYSASNPRIEICVRGGVYRSQFLRDLCISPDVTHFISDICAVDLMPHTIPHQLGHLNYNPTNINDNIDKWHYDTLRFDYVLFVTDPNSIDGGEFQYFEGTKHELKAIKEQQQSVPLERIVSPIMPKAGYAVMQQGNMVVHRAKALHNAGERITMVNGYTTKLATCQDYTRYDQLQLVDPPHIVTSEYTRHIMAQAVEFCQNELNQPSFYDNNAFYERQLQQLAKLFTEAVQNVSNNTKHDIEHFGD